MWLNTRLHFITIAKRSAAKAIEILIHSFSNPPFLFSPAIHLFLNLSPTMKKYANPLPALNNLQFKWDGTKWDWCGAAWNVMNNKHHRIWKEWITVEWNIDIEILLIWWVKPEGQSNPMFYGAGLLDDDTVVKFKINWELKHVIWSKLHFVFN